MADKKIVIEKNGPYLVEGNVPLDTVVAEAGESGAPERWVQGKKVTSGSSYSLCRCGKSASKPFCDGTHVTSHFDGSETAPRTPFIKQAQKLDGPGLDLLDALPLCSGARFCEPGGSIWNLLPRTDDPEARATAVREACDCPSGRLVAFDKQAGAPIEPEFPPSISLIEDPQVMTSGPLWVKGRIPVASADGTPYEVRNRLTLCRCGESANKPFCDGRHFRIGFNDGDESLRGQDSVRS